MEGQWLVKNGAHRCIHGNWESIYGLQGRGQRHDVLYEKRHETPPFFKTATKRTLTQREHVDKRNEYFIAAFQWHVNYS